MLVGSWPREETAWRTEAPIYESCFLAFESVNPVHQMFKRIGRVWTRFLLDLYLTGNCNPRAIAGRYSTCASAGNAGLTLEALVSMVVQDLLNGLHRSSV
jgi:hypothetical protein